MAKKTSKTEAVQMGKAVNCSDKCINYEVCEVEGNFSRFMPGATCPDISLENETETVSDDSENLQDEPKADENTGQDSKNTGEETPPNEPKADEKPETPTNETETITVKRYVFPRQGDIKCPGCGLYETVAVSTRGAVQVRKCTRSIPVCEYTSKTFKVEGTEVKIKSTDCKQDT